MILRRHQIILQGVRVTLRPMMEDDWPVLLKWNQDPEVLYFTEGDEVSSYTLDQVQDIYRGVSQTAFCFIIEVAHQPIGECWLQQMNLDRIAQQHPGCDCRRIDLLIGEKAFWGQGLGSETIQLLSSWAFDEEAADLVFACEVAEYNRASLKAFQKAGYVVTAQIEQPRGKKARYCYDLVLTRESYTMRKSGASQGTTEGR